MSYVRSALHYRARKNDGDLLGRLDEACEHLDLGVVEGIVDEDGGTDARSYRAVVRVFLEVQDDRETDVPAGARHALEEMGVLLNINCW